MATIEDPNYVIRHATRDDCVAIAQLIKELAEFEGMAERAEEMTSETLARDGFDSSPPYFRCLVAVASGETIGYAMYYLSYSPWIARTMHLEDIYVRQTHRKMGLGTALMKEVAAVAVQHGCSMMEWIVLGWNQLATSLYDGLGAEDVTKSEDWHLYRLGREKMESLSRGTAARRSLGGGARLDGATPRNEDASGAAHSDDVALTSGAAGGADCAAGDGRAGNDVRGESEGACEGAPREEEYLEGTELSSPAASGKQGRADAPFGADERGRP